MTSVNPSSSDAIKAICFPAILLDEKVNKTEGFSACSKKRIVGWVLTLTLVAWAVYLSWNCNKFTDKFERIIYAILAGIFHLIYLVYYFVYYYLGRRSCY